MDNLFCRECGCEIRCVEDIGFRDTGVKTVLGPFVGTYIEIEVEIIICRSCVEEEERVIRYAEHLMLDCDTGYAMWHTTEHDRGYKA